ncbi:MAG: thiol peroxidase [Bacteroidia bacterium]
MTKITIGGNPINTNATLPEVGTNAQDFKLTDVKLADKTLADFEGENLVLNIFPSVDTAVCATSVRKFNEKAASLANTKVLCISKDLPFAQNRFCGAEGIEDVVMLSDFKTGDFGKNYGLELIDGPFQGLHSRCIVIINKEGHIAYTEQVGEIADEPNYDAALAAL